MTRINMRSAILVLFETSHMNKVLCALMIAQTIENRLSAIGNIELDITRSKDLFTLTLPFVDSTTQSILVMNRG